MNKEYPVAFACHHMDPSIQMRSTSGGVFYALARNFIENRRGYVCGAVFDDDFSVKHIVIDRVENIDRLCGSKYPQSRLGDTFAKVRKLLDAGENVLFVGTPCQVAGFKRFCGTEYANLWCIDFVCYGVASPKIWDRYLTEYTDRDSLVSVAFKDKVKGWKRWHVRLSYRNEDTYQRGNMNMFMRSYLAGVNIRPSCFSCAFKGLKRDSDFTIADCWGIGEENKEINDDRGLSALLIQNERAETLWKDIADQFVLREYDADQLMEKNWAALRSVQMREDRRRFFDYLETHTLKKTMNRFFRKSLRETARYYFDKTRGLVK